MNLANTLHDIQQLPLEAQAQLADFVEFLKFRYRQNLHQTNIENIPDDVSFGAIHVKKQVSLAQMEEAIKQQGSQL